MARHRFHTRRWFPHSLTRLDLVHLEDRVVPANVLANDPEPNQSTLTTAFTQSETSSIAFGNTILVSYNDSGSNKAGNHFTGWSRSTDNGVTFTDMGVLPGNNDAGDPVFARNNSTGRIYLSTLSFTSGNTLQMFRSDDDGLSFLSAVNPMPVSSGTPSYDKEWITVDNFPGPGNGNVYIVARDFGTANGIVFSRSTDHGNTWTNATTIVTLGSTNVQGPNIVVNADHSLTAIWYEQTTTQTLRAARSTDFGNTWSPAVTVATLSTTGVNGNLNLTRSNTNTASFRSNTFPQVVVHPTQAGRIYAAYTDNPPGVDKADIFLVQSGDFGATWSAPLRVNTDATTNDQFHPAISITPNGAYLSVSWYDRRLSADNSAIDYYARIAAISGATLTFQPDFRVTDTSFLPDFGRDSLINPQYMGDYDQSTATNSRFYYIWSDNRLGGPDVRVDSVAVAPAGGPYVAVSTPNGVTASASPIDITFNEAMNPGSFSFANDLVSYKRDGIDVSAELTGFSWINSNTTLRITNSSATPGNYTLRLGPQILSAVGSLPLDNDFDGTPGESLDDQVVINFTLPSPRITSNTPTGNVVAPISSATFNFNQVMDTSSFSVASDVFSFTGTAGNLIPFITGFTWVTNQQLRIDFNAITLPGVYTLVLNPTINNAGGFPCDNNNNGTPNEIPGDRYTATFTIGPSGGGSSNSFGYRFAAVPIDTTLATVTTNVLTSLNSVDDATQTINLSPNNFNYYGTTYTSLFVSSNGNIHFGTSNNAFTNTDLTVSPAQAFICPLWDDHVTNRNIAPDDQVFWRIQDNQLVVNWRNIHYINGPSNANGITFQAVLQLNTGTTAGTMTFHYTDLDDGSSGTQNNGNSATVGIKNAGTTPATGDPLVAAFNGNNPSLIATGKAVRFFKNTAPIAEANGPYTVASGSTVALSSAGTSDPDGDTLSFIWDLDGDGTFGETGPGALRGDEVGPSPTFNAVGAPGGAYTVALRVVDPSGEIANDTATVNVTGGATVSSIVINSGAIQRSRITTITVNLSSAVDASAFAAAGAVTLTRLASSGVGLPIGHVVNSTNGLVVSPASGMTTTLTLTFANVVNAGVDNSSLADGRWQLALNPISFTSNDTVPAQQIRRIFGDANGDGTVDGTDFSNFGTAFGNPGVAFDFDNNGTIDGNDFSEFGNRFGRTV